MEGRELFSPRCALMLWFEFTPPRLPVCLRFFLLYFRETKTEVRVTWEKERGKQGLRRSQLRGGVNLYITPLIPLLLLPFLLPPSPLLFSKGAQDL